ncbi:MAG: response regulator [Bacteroidetes bacterium]|nr:response regulator [Bacteroidota bacterium]MBU1372731.1 response regulator [Bacteroidota bacterium]MBU1484927.1 response regulator [Bacteroidota bacterium]MBU1761541.1 response regulator [Bacteroidota bacterium]MBU2267089.1 response regulator [Bacteroidota bacterium]
MANNKILVIDDERLINKFLASRLEREAWDVDTAIDGIEAMNKITRNKYDLILTDLIMPNVAGLELVIYIKNSKLNADVPIIVISSLTSDNVILDVLSIGVEEYISKPFSMNVVIAKIKQILGKKSVA